MIRIEGTRVELWTLPGKVGVLTGPNGDELTVADARRVATQLLRAANEAERKAETPPASAVAAAEVPPEFVLPHIAAGIGGGIDPAEVPDELAPMTGAEALDAAAAQGPDAFAETLNNVIGAFAQAAICPAQYERPGGAQPGDRIVRCGLNAGHPGEHEEADTLITWGGAR